MDLEQDEQDESREEGGRGRAEGKARRQTTYEGERTLQQIMSSAFSSYYDSYHGEDVNGVFYDDAFEDFSKA